MVLDVQHLRRQVAGAELRAPIGKLPINRYSLARELISLRVGHRHTYSVSRRPLGQRSSWPDGFAH